MSANAFAQRRDRPPSAGHMRTDSRGLSLLLGSAGSATASGRNQFGHAQMMAFETQTQPSSMYEQHTGFAMGQQQAPATQASPQFSPNGTSSFRASYPATTTTGVKLPAAVAYAPPTTQNDAQVLELRQQLTREIDYRRQLEGEVVGLKDTVGLLFLAHQQRLAKEQQQAEDEADMTSTVIGGGSGRRPRSAMKQRAPHPPPPPPPTQPINLTPVQPVSTKVLELEEKWKEGKREASERHEEVERRVGQLEEKMLEVMREQRALAERTHDQATQATTNLSTVEARLRTDLRHSDTANTAMHEQHAETLARLTSTIDLLRSSVDSTRTLRTDVDALAATLTDTQRSVQSLSALAITMPKQIEALARVSEADREKRTGREEKGAADVQAVAASVREVQGKLDALAKSAAATQQVVDTHHSTGTTRFRHIEEAIRLLPQPDATLPGRVNNLYVQVDRMEQTVEMLAKSGAAAAAKGKTQPIATKPPSTPAVSTEAEENMRAIRSAIGTVDAKITESNHLNTQLHERMNGIDANLQGNKKAIGDMIQRVKTTTQAQKDLETLVETLQATVATTETKLTKLEQKERERKRAEKEGETNSAATAAATAAPAAAATPTPATPQTEADLPDAWKVLVDDRLRKERGKAKIASKQLELAQSEMAAALTAVQARVDAGETARKKANAEEKKRGEERAREEERRASEAEEKAKVAQASLDQQAALLTAHGDSLKALTSRVDALRSSVDSFADTSTALEQQVRQAQLLSADEATKVSQRLEAAVGEMKLSFASTTDLAQLRSDLASTQSQQAQAWALATECSKEVEKVERLVADAQEKLHRLTSQLAASTANPATPALDEPRVLAILAAQQAPLLQQVSDHASLLSRLASSVVDAKSPPADVAAFAASVAELRLRHEQFSREVDLLEIKLAEQMAQTEYAQENLDLIATKVQVQLPKRKPVGKGK